MADNNNNNNLLGFGLAGLGSSLVGGGLSYLTGRASQEHAAELQWQNWKRMFDYEAEYNKPINQLKRSAAAGVNPFVSPAGAQMVGTSSMQMGAPAAAPGASPVPFDFGTNFNQIMSGLLAVRQSEGEGIKNKNLQSFLDAQIKNQLSQAGYNDVQSAYQNMANEIYREFGRKKNDAELQNLLKDLETKQADILLKSSERGYYDQSRMESLAREAHERALAVLGQKDIDAFDTRLRTWIRQAESQIKANLAGAYESGERAKLAGAQTETENALRSGRVSAQALENGLSAIDFLVNSQENEDGELRMIEQLRNEVELKSKENNTFYWRFAAEMLSALAQGAFSVTFAGKVLRAARGAQSAVQATKQLKSAGVGDITEHVAKPTPKGSGAPVFPRDKDKYPNLYHIWQMGQH